jgi:uncharacterized membrane protein
VTAKATTTTTINAFFGVDLTVSNPSKPAFPGKWAAFKVKVKNTGNSQDTFNFDVTGDSAAWVATLDPVTIDPGKTKTIDFNLTPPLDVENGVYTFTLNASSDTQGDAWDELELEVDINVYHGLLVTLSETDIESRPGDTETVQVFVENTGNVNDTFDVRALGSYASWVTIDNLTLDADEGESAVATATIVVNATLSGNYKIRFEVTSRAGGNVSEAELTISIQLTYGVSMAPLKDDHPGAPDYNVTIEVELTNEGNIEDTFGLGTPQLPGSLWDATLDRNQLTVAGGGSGFFNVTVYIPDGVVAGDYVVRVKASSTKSPNVPKPSDTVLLNISIAFDVSATGPAGTISLYPEESRTVQVTVKNEGLGRDTIKLYIDDEEYKDWAVPAVTSVVLRAGQTALVDVAVSPPANALAGTYVIKLRAESGSDEDVYDIADTRVTVRQVYSVFVEPISSYLEGVAGIRHEVTLRVHNDGNGEDDISLYPIAPSGVDIEATLSRGTVTLAAHENITVILRIKADTDVEAGAHMIEVEARSRSSTVLPYRVTVTYEIPAYHEVSVLTSEGLESFTIGDATVGQTYQVTIEVFNLGNVVDTYNLFASSDDVDVPTWITFPTSDVTVDAGTSEVLIVDIGVPGSVMAGTYDLELVAKSSTANESAAVTGTIVIGQDRSVTLSALITTKTLDPTSTQGVTFDITVRNDGNVAESVSLEVTYPSGWQPPSIDPTTVTVPAYGTAMVKVTFSSSSAPSNAAATNAITAKGLYNNDNLESPLLNLVVDVLQPDVDVKSIVLKPPKPQQDDVVTVEITLENSGVVDATGLTVTLLVDGSPAGSQTNQQVKAGETKTVAMDWEVLAGAGDVLTLEVRIPQLDLTYQHPMPVTIDSGERSFFDRLTDLPFLTVVIMGLVIGLIIGLAIAGGVHKRGKKRLEAARAAGMAEGLTMADMEKAEEEGAEGILDDEEAEDEGGDEEGDEEGTEEDVVEEGDEEEVPPVTVQCPKCDTLNKVTTAQRPYEFRCEKCNALLRLSR